MLFARVPPEIMNSPKIAPWKGARNPRTPSDCDGTPVANPGLRASRLTPGYSHRTPPACKMANLQPSSEEGRCADKTLGPRLFPHRQRGFRRRGFILQLVRNSESNDVFTGGEIRNANGFR